MSGFSQWRRSYQVERRRQYRTVAVEQAGARRERIQRASTLGHDQPSHAVTPGSTASIRDRSLDQLVKSIENPTAARLPACARLCRPRCQGRQPAPGPGRGLTQKPCRAKSPSVVPPDRRVGPPFRHIGDETVAERQSLQRPVVARAVRARRCRGRRNPDTADPGTATFSRPRASIRRRNSSRCRHRRPRMQSSSRRAQSRSASRATVNSSWPSGSRRSIWTMPAGPRGCRGQPYALS